MQVQTVTVAVEFTHNLGNYSNIKPYVSLTALVFEGDELSEALQSLHWMVLGQIDTLVSDGIVQHKKRLEAADRPF